LKETTRCKLLARLLDDKLLEVATGMAYPSNEGDLIHGVPMARRNAKVTVDSVYDTCKNIKLKFPPNDEITKLGQAEGTFIQWPKRDVVLEDRRPPSREQDVPALPEPNVSHNEATTVATMPPETTSFALDLPTKAHSSPAKAS
jgi:hypothetical protein